MAALHQKAGRNVTEEPKHPPDVHTHKEETGSGERRGGREEGGGGCSGERQKRQERERKKEQWLPPPLFPLAPSLYLCEHLQALFIHYSAMVPNEPGISTLTLTLD